MIRKDLIDFEKDANIFNEAKIKEKTPIHLHEIMKNNY